MLYILLFVASFMAGSYYKDWMIKRHIREASIKHYNDDSFLIGDSLDHIRCMNILDEEELRNIIAEL